MVSMINDYRNLWFFYGLAAAVSYAFQTIFFKYMLTQGYSAQVLVFIVFFFVFIGFFAVVSIKKIKFRLSLPVIGFFILASLFAIFANYFDLNAVRLAPNPGYASTLKGMQSIGIALLAPLFFKSKLSWIKVFGILIVIAGAFFVSVF